MKKKLSEKFKEYIKYLKMNYQKFIFYFLGTINPSPEIFRVKINTRCLVLSHKIGEETKAMGGLMAQYPKNFEVLAFTDASDSDTTKTSAECALAKKSQFKNVMKELRVKGFKEFGIASGTLKDEFQKIKKIDISEADCIFIPNIFDTDPDAQALIRHFKKLLETKEYKKTLKILMYESTSALLRIDYFADISNIARTKGQMLEIYYGKKSPHSEAILGLNRFRGLSLKRKLCEGFMCFSSNEFLNLPIG